MLGVLLAAQGLVGSVQYELHLPTDMVWVHVTLATFTWVVVLWAVAAAGRLVPRARTVPAARVPAGSRDLGRRRRPHRRVAESPSGCRVRSRAERRGLSLRSTCCMSSERTASRIRRHRRAGRDASLSILVVDDESDLREMLTRSFSREGHRVMAVADGRAAIDRASTEHFDIVLLDVALGAGPDGYEVCRTLRGRRNVVPIIMLTALDSEADAVLGLEAGADDYVTKPFGLAELRSRIRAVLRRAGTRAMGDEVLVVGPITLDRAQREVTMDGEPVRLTFSEFELLDALMADPGRLLNRQELLRAIWGDSAYRDPRAIDVHIRHLREKLEPEPEKPRYILTVRGAGYRLRGPLVRCRARPRRAAPLGLRGRIVGALLVTTVATLGVAARGAARAAGAAAAQRRADDAATGRLRRPRPDFQKLDLGAVAETSPAAQRRLARAPAPTRWRVRIGAPNVSVFGYPTSSAADLLRRRRASAATRFDDRRDGRSGPWPSAKTGNAAAVPSFGTVEGTDVARVAVPITLPDRAARPTCSPCARPIEEIPGAVKRRAHGVHHRRAGRAWR